MGISRNPFERIPALRASIAVAGALLHDIEQQHPHCSSHFDHIRHALKVEGSSDRQAVVGVVLKNGAQ